MLEVERRRLATIDDAERQARVEVKEGREREKQEEMRMNSEQEALLEWEAYVPPKPEPDTPEEFEVKEFKADEKVVVFANDMVVSLSPEWGEEQIENLVAALSPENLEGGKRVMASLAPGAEEGEFFLGEFRVGEPALIEENAV